MPQSRDLGNISRPTRCTQQNLPTEKFPERIRNEVLPIIDEIVRFPSAFDSYCRVSRGLNHTRAHLCLNHGLRCDIAKTFSLLKRGVRDL